MLKISTPMYQKFHLSVMNTRSKPDHSCTSPTGEWNTKLLITFSTGLHPLYILSFIITKWNIRLHNLLRDKKETNRLFAIPNHNNEKHNLIRSTRITPKNQSIQKKFRLFNQSSTNYFWMRMRQLLYYSIE